ncbi:MAG: carboxypeptidase-like regulatory domain-containing protein, partial [Rhodothermales bacterium]
MLLAGVVATPVAGQGTLAGTVLDADTRESLIGVNVIVVGTNSGSATDFDGRYSVPGLKSGEYSIRVSYIGYETTMFTGIRIRNGEETVLNVDLQEAVLSTGQEIVIVGDKPLVDVEQSTSAYTVGREMIEAAPLRSVQDVVSTQAGVISDPTGLYIRGGRANETGYIVDGVSAKDPLAGTGFGLDLGSNALEQVEVTTG